MNDSNSSTSNSITHFDTFSFAYTPFYCEENVYLLCKKLCMMGLADTAGLDLFVVFISNEDKQIPLWHQKAGKNTDGLALWDYHVICIQKSQDKEKDNALHQVWDLDSSLPFPFSLNQYVAKAIRPSIPVNSKFSRLFRVVHAPIFLHCFASDRHHMKKPGGSWIAPPPAYESIVAEDGTTNNLDEWLRMHAGDVSANVADLVPGLFSEKFGVVVNEMQLLDLLSQIP